MGKEGSEIDFLKHKNAKEFLESNGLSVEAGLEVVDQEIERLKEKEKKGDVVNDKK